MDVQQRDGAARPQVDPRVRVPPNMAPVGTSRQALSKTDWCTVEDLEFKCECSVLRVYRQGPLPPRLESQLSVDFSGTGRQLSRTSLSTFVWWVSAGRSAAEREGTSNVFSSYTSKLGDI